MELKIQLPDNPESLDYEALTKVHEQLCVFEGEVAKYHSRVGQLRQKHDSTQEALRKLNSMSTDERQALLTLLRPAGVKSQEGVGQPGA